MSIKKLIASIGLTALAATAHAVPILPLYNAYTFGDFTANSTDSEGALLIGGSAYLSGYGINTRYGDPQTALIIGGDVNLSNGQIYGSAYVGGTANLTSAGVLGQVYQETAPFSAWEQYFNQLSATWANTASTGSVQRMPWGQLILNNSGPGSQGVFNLTANDLNGINQISFQGLTLGQQVILNVTGQAITLTNFDLSQSLAAYDVLFNFVDAESLTIMNASPHADILAPNALISGANGHIEGTLVADEFNAHLELHNGRGRYLRLPEFTPPPPNVVPEPGSVPLLLAGVFAAFLFKRKNKTIN